LVRRIGFIHVAQKEFLVTSICALAFYVYVTWAVFTLKMKATILFCTTLYYCDSRRAVYGGAAKTSEQRVVFITFYETGIT